MDTLIIATISAEHNDLREALIQQLGRWKIMRKAELVFLAEGLDEGGEMPCSKLAMKFETHASARDFISEFSEEAASTAHEPQLEKFSLVKSPMIDALTSRF